MKRLNKKGFTLIELLAVIIILGILMIIAIPSVTSYIQNSRKSAYADTAVQYADAVIKEVNGGKSFRLYSTTTLYMIPVGHQKDKSCVTLESGGQSPFSDDWRYAYVGVTYDGKGYNYYFIGEDGAGQGVNFLDKKTLTDDGTDYIYSTYGETLAMAAKGAENMTSSFSGKLKTLYATAATAASGTPGQSGYTPAVSTVVHEGSTGDNSISTEEQTALIGMITNKEGSNKQIKKIVYILGTGADGARCQYTEAVTASS